jgi:hypothetical protein
VKLSCVNRTLVSIALVFLLGCAVVTLDMIGVAGPTPNPSTSPSPTVGAIEDEFVGPFTSWTNVQTSCGATGNGSTDDTSAIQTCLTNDTGSSTLYFPAGTYKISSTLNVTGHVRIVGADPTTTSLVWAGTGGGTMLTFNASFSSLGRLTFNGSGTAGTDVTVASTAVFQTANLFHDMYFTNAGIGLDIAVNLSNSIASEQTCLRCQFLNNTSEGLYVFGANSVDIWIWDSYFSGNAIGATQASNGSFAIYNSTFVNQTTGDALVTSTNNTGIEFRYDVSSGSPYFSSITSSASSSPMTFQGNRLLDTNTAPIVENVAGPSFFLDNLIRSPSGGSSAAVTVGNGVNAPAVTAMGNTFTTTAASPISVTGNTPIRLYEQNDTTSSSYANFPSSVPTAVPPPPNNNRTICEVAAGQGSSTIQTCVNNAVAGTRSVVHLAAGSHNIASTINIPAGLDVQFIGDGFTSGQTDLSWSGGASGPIFKCNSPCQAWFRDFFLDGGSQAVNAFDIHSDDSATARVQILEPYSGATGPVVSATGLTNTLVNLYDNSIGATGSIATVTGTGASVSSRILFTGAGAAGAQAAGSTLYTVTNDGNLVVWNNWNENGSTQYYVTNQTGGNGNVAISNLFTADNAATGASILNLNNWTGNYLISGWHSIYGTGNGGVPTDSNNNANTNIFIDMSGETDSTHPWFAPTTGGNIFLRGGWCLGAFGSGPTTGACNGTSGYMADIGSPSAAQVTSAYALLRATTGDQDNTTLGSGITDFQATKLWVQNVNIAYHVVNP